MLISGAKNLFRVVTNRIYSPMAKTLSDYFLNPVYLIYYYGACNDFTIKDKFDALYFSINFIISVLISFFGCVYNEFIILFCCGLGHDTHYLITKRSEENLQMELTKVNDSFDTHNLENSSDKIKVDSESENSLIE